MLLSLAYTSHAQVIRVRPSELNPGLDSLFTAGRFAEIEIEVLRTLRREPPANNEELIAAYLYLGFVEVFSGREDDAQNDFIKALKLKPSLILDPFYVPPMIFAAFEKARQNYEESVSRASEELPSDELDNSLAQLPAYKSRSAWKTMSNMIAPGSGFMMEKRFIKGSMWTLLQASAVSGFVYSFQKTSDARHDYMSTSNETKFDDAYDYYNKWYNRTWIWGGAGIAVYIASQLDFFCNPLPVNITISTLDGSGGNIPAVGISFPMK
ncbi:MAG: hypothetical protein P9L92_20340 [Candidatus Electryonea clarkiae]|nr:hypothetical protein [Candidatus Electryonea clarkiae]